VPTAAGGQLRMPVWASTVCGYGQLRPDPRRARPGTFCGQAVSTGAERHYPDSSAVRIFSPSTRLGKFSLLRNFSA
jgi:hypothetical protein